MPGQGSCRSQALERKGNLTRLWETEEVGKAGRERNLVRFLDTEQARRDRKERNLAMFLETKQAGRGGKERNLVRLLENEQLGRGGRGSFPSPERWRFNSWVHSGSGEFFRSRWHS